MQGVDEHRTDREAGRLVYPVVSRRSGGLSLGVNLFPQAKVCSFDCPYCEVFAAPGTSEGLSLAGLEEELESFLEDGYAATWSPSPVRDLCVSGNGEPTQSPRLGEVLELLARIRRSHRDILGESELVLITNSTGFLDPGVSGLLERFVREEGLVLWSKLDAGNEELFGLMSGLGRGLSAAWGLERIARGILDFSSRSPIVIQTMLCEVEGRKPSDADLFDYSVLISRLLSQGARIAELHLYTYARPSPGGRCAALSDEELLRSAASIGGSTGLRVRAFGRAELEIPSAARAELEIPSAARAELEIPGAASDESS
jgi:wyosine [tRNA(Phe)-imidazoG37] synthetase (radical SAM superfamily)